MKTDNGPPPRRHSYQFYEVGASIARRDRDPRGYRPAATDAHIGHGNLPADSVRLNYLVRRLKLRARPRVSRFALSERTYPRAATCTLAALHRAGHSYSLGSVPIRAT